MAVLFHAGSHLPAGQRSLACTFGISAVKDHFTNFVQWLGAACSLLLLLYFLASPLIFLNTTRGPAASSLLRKLSGPVIHVLESDYKGPVLWYFGLWGIGVDYFSGDPQPTPWYVTPVYASVGLVSLAAVAYPSRKWYRKRKCNHAERG